MTHTTPSTPTDNSNPAYNCPHCGAENYQQGDALTVRTDYLVFCDTHCLTEWVEHQLVNDNPGCRIDDEVAAAEIALEHEDKVPDEVVALVER